MKPGAVVGAILSTCRRLGAALTITLLTVACGVLSPEEQLLADFFEASRLHDTTAVARISSVTFNPRIAGVVHSFDVEDVREEGDTRRAHVRLVVRQPDGSVAGRPMVFTFVTKQGRPFIASIESDGP